MKMVSSSFSILLLALLFLQLSFSLSFAHNQTTPPSSKTPAQTTTKIYKNCFQKVFAFGDSFTDTGNAEVLGGLISFSGALTPGSPYGSSFFKQSAGRFSDGRLIIDFLTERLNIPYLPAYNGSSNFTYGVNFAVGGASSVTSDYFLNYTVGRTIAWRDIPDCYQTQLDWFNQFVNDVECIGKDENACKADLGNVLYYIGGLGSTDYSRTFGKHFTTQAIAQAAVNHVTNLLEAILNKGGKYILVHGLPPSGCFPLDVSLSPHWDHDQYGCSKTVNRMIKAHNDLLESKLKEIQQQYSGATIIYADFWEAFQKIMSNAKQYGFKEPHKACCGSGDTNLNFDLHSICGSSDTTACPNPEKHINWDGVHLTEAMYAKMAELFFDEGYCQPSFDKLLANKKCT